MIFNRKLKTIGRTLINRSTWSFSKKKQTKKQTLSDNYVRESVEIEEKYRNKSAILYDQYLKERERPALTLDNYQLRYTFLIERPPIFVPYHPRKFDYYRTKYNFLKKTGYYMQLPKELQVQTGDYLFSQYERVNSENVITHRNAISKSEVYEFAENSRYWRYTDPEIEDPKSVQTYASDNVFLIVKDSNGEWKFPSRQISEKDNHKEVFIHFNEELFGGAPNPLVHFSSNQPVYSRRVEDETFERGDGYYELFFKGISINGIPSFPTKNFQDFAWVPKPHLSEYFTDDYYQEVIKLTVHLC